MEKGNEAAADGSMSQAINDLVDQVKPESVYFYVQDGKRAGMIIRYLPALPGASCATTAIRCRAGCTGNDGSAAFV